MPDAKIAPVAPVKLSDVSIKKPKAQDDRVALGLHKFRSTGKSKAYLYAVIFDALQDAWRAGMKFDENHVEAICSYIIGAYSLRIDGALNEIIRLEIKDRLEKMIKDNSGKNP